MFKEIQIQNKTNGAGQKNALIYCRVSSKRQERERFWLETQESMCKERCEKNWINVVKVIKDWWISWSTFDRDWFDEVLEIFDKQTKKIQRIQKKKNLINVNPNEIGNDPETGMPPITHFVCVDGSRISRNDKLEETYFMTGKIRQSGAEIVYVLYPIDATSSAWMLQENILYAFSAFERRNTRCKAMNWMRARLLEGYRPFGTLPIWFAREKQWKHSVVVMEPTKWPIVKEALEMFASGVLESEASVYRYMKDKWVKTNSTQNRTGYMHKSIVESLFSLNRLYFMAGFIYYPRRDINELIPARHDPLISMETVEQILVRMKMSYQAWRSHLKNNPDFPLKDFLYCGHCWKKLVGYRAKWRSDKYPYYWCSNKKDENRSQIRREVIHEEFDKLLSSVQIGENLRTLMDQGIRKLWNERQKFRNQLAQDKEKALEDINEKMKRVRMTMLATKSLELVEELESERELYRMDRDRLKEEITKKSELSDKELNDCLVQAKRIYMWPRSVWELSNTELKRTLMNLLFGEKLLYTKERGYRTAWNTLFHLVFSLIQRPDFLDQDKNKK